MPYKVRKEGDKWCVKKKEGDSLVTIPGGCHPTREKAIKHMQAIVINENAEFDVEKESVMSYRLKITDPAE